MIQEEDELLDLVDKDDRVVGTVMRELHHADPKSYVEKGQYFRGTGCFLVNSDDKVWIPRRQAWRKIVPGGLDFSMAEHVQSGESHLQAAVRGMKEELRLDLRPSDLELIGKKTFDSFGCVMSIYLYRSDDDPNYSEDDYQSASWMTLDELRAKFTSGEMFKDALPLWLEELQESLNA